MSRRTWIYLAIIAILVMGGVVIGMSIIFFNFLIPEIKVIPTFGKAVALIEIEGVITDSEPIIRQLKKYKKDPEIRAIVLRIDSPGGGAAAAQEIYEEIGKVKEEGKKVVCSMGALAASGGYYIACAAETILANPGTITGSIGVIMEIPNTQELLRKIGLKFEVVKSGEHKDIASPFREMTKKERDLLQNMINDIYNQFVETVVKERKLPHDEVLKIADGRIFSGRQARELKLVDKLGNLEDSIRLAGRMAGIKGVPRVVKEKKRRFVLFDLLSQALGTISNAQRNNLKAEYRLIF